MKYYGITDRGRMRRTNQDNYGIATNLKGDVFAMVCDGIGGANGGDIASRMTVDYFAEIFASQPGFSSADEVRKWLRHHITIINSRIYKKGKSSDEFKGMGTTLCGIVMTSAGSFVLNIGDSRAYVLDEQGQLKQLTTDHTLVQDMISHGELTRQEAQTYPRKNVLTNALGVWDTVRSDIDALPEEARAYLICTDGLHGYVPEEKIQSIMNNRRRDPSLRIRQLVRAALDAGGYDNITVILMDLEGDAGNEQ